MSRIVAYPPSIFGTAETLGSFCFRRFHSLRGSRPLCNVRCGCSRRTASSLWEDLEWLRRERLVFSQSWRMCGSTRGSITIDQKVYAVNPIHARLASTLSLNVFESLNLSSLSLWHRLLRTFCCVCSVPYSNFQQLHGQQLSRFLGDPQLAASAHEMVWFEVKTAGSPPA